MIDTTTYREMYPQGRHLYYEGDDPDGFADTIAAEFGFDPRDETNCCMYGPDWGYHPELWKYIPEVGFTPRDFHCPAEHLDAIYGSDRWELGT